MSAKKQTRNRPPHKPHSDFQRLSRRFMSGLLRSLFFINKQNRYSKAGFVLPTTVLLLLVMTLTVGALSFRTASRTQSVFLAREQQAIDNVAAPAVDRAKAKLEYLFSQDVRMPGSGAPSSDVLAVLLRNVTDASLGISKFGTDDDPFDPYTLNDESRLDINGNGELDNAWSFELTPAGSDTPKTIVYSLLTDDAVDPAEAVGATAGGTVTEERDNDIKLEDVGDAKTELKAKNLIVRNGPINTDQSLSACGGSREPEQGWLPISSATLEKNFQITAYVSNGEGLGRANSALELQQVRRATKGNKWGAWFRYDLELHPGADFNWNGAMHTEGSLFAANNFKAHMISSHNSCLYTEDASEITIAEIDYDKDEVIAITQGDFDGQITSANPAYGSFKNQKAKIHVFNGLSIAPKTGGDGVNGVDLKNDRDSINGTNYDDALEVEIDPVALFTRNISQHRGTSWSRTSDWDNRAMANGRVRSESKEAPYLDDFYRADGRYGPNPDYGDTNWVTATEEEADGSKKVENDRTKDGYDIKLGDEILGDDPNADSLINENAGLDGYWERQAILKGLRVVVGQRLELGNTQGWNYNAATGAIVAGTDPLYPPNASIANKQRQRVTLRDNLAAVQGMVVYYYQNDAGQYPLACVANTAHPGTLETLINSRNFTEETVNGNTLISNFFTGKGTNGWEYDFPTTFKSKATGGTDDSFGVALAQDKPLGVALRNLAHFAGDPNGGSPSFTPEQEDGFVHPYPPMAMWGDYSVLRRIFDERLDDAAWNTSLDISTNMGGRYEALSSADKSSLHSAACTMGLLGRYIDTTDQEVDWVTTLSATPTDFGPNANDIRNNLNNLVGDKIIKGLGMQGGQPKDGSWAKTNCTESSTGSKDWDCTNNSGSLILPPTREEAIDAVIAEGASPTGKEIRFIELLSDTSQIRWDRENGSNTSSGAFTPLIIEPDTTTKYKVNLPNECIPGASTNMDNLYGTPFDASDPNRTKLPAVALTCASRSKYPSLHYLFPLSNHGHTDLDGVADDYIFNDQGTSDTTDDIGVNKDYEYEVVGDDDGNGVEDDGELGMGAIAFNYKATVGDFKLPVTVPTSAASGGTLNPETMQIIDPDGDLAEVSLLDKGMFNAREGMAVRVLDVNLAKLTQTKNLAPNPATVDGETVVGDYWISDDQDATSGIFYAAREDAVREDAITRPVSVVGATSTSTGTATEWEDCDTLAELIGSNTSETTRRCWMRPTGSEQTDPPLSRRDDGNSSTEGSLIGISVKPVDFAPDPDRRPHGFRLNAHLKDKNGDDNNGDLSDDKTRNWGLTFVTDNAAYIRGEFNPHTKTGAASDTLEEFEETLYGAGSTVKFGDEFYTKRKTYDTDEFATRSADRWRVTEVLADAVTLLSENFVDGAIQEGFIRDRDVLSTDFANIAGDPSSTSFHNQQRPLDEDKKAWGDDTEWLRVDGSNNAQLPIWVGQNGESQLFDGSKSFTDATRDADFLKPTEQGNEAQGVIDAAAPERMAATFISGLVPSRNRQTYGGLHNFPRFLEDWNDDDLYIQGAFLQLKFSTASTAPFDADAWDPGDTPVNAERILYYKPPSRQWGYDVGLQYATAGPIAQRFVTLEKPRSEHYRELPVDDPYVTNLRCARVKDEDSGNFVQLLDDEVGCPSP